MSGRPQPWPWSFEGQCVISRTPAGIHIDKADDAIRISPELIAEAARGELTACTLTGNILTLRGVNATVRYWADFAGDPTTWVRPDQLAVGVPAKRIPAPVCPECAQTKHRNCVGQALDTLTDDICECMCRHDAWENS